MLRDKKFKMTYSTGADNIQKDFYDKALSEAVKYKRVSGYFSSAALSLFAKGLYGLYKNNGKYQLIISNTISDEDYILMKKGYLDKNNFQSDVKKKLSDFNELSLNQKNDFCNLAYLIEIGLVEIKVGFKNSGIFHAKYGIIGDGNDYLFFSGSLNETKAAFLNNYESITVNKSWTSDEDKVSIIEREVAFNDLWNNSSDDDTIMVKEFDEILRDELISFSKGKFIKMDSSESAKEQIVLKYDGKLMMEINYPNFEFDYSDSDIRTIRNVYLLDKDKWVFKDELSVNNVSYIVDSITSYCQNRNLNLRISDDLFKFLKKSNDLPIDKLREMGTLIKEKDDSILSEFKKFKTVVSLGMSRQLREQQMWASFYMKAMKRVGNFSVPGSGKTSMVYGTFSYLRAIYDIEKILVVGPKNSFKAWRDEFYENFGNDAILSVYDVQDKNRRPIMSSKEYNLYLFNYESLPGNTDIIFNDILDDKTLVVFDEGHKIKSTDSKKAQICIDISKKVEYCMVLTGTPIPNSYSDIWNFMHILYNLDYGKVFGLDLNELKKAKNDSSESNEINEKLYPFYWRTNKKQLQVPDANDDHIYRSVVSEDEQKWASYLWDRYSDQPIVLFIRLIQLSSNPSLLLKKISSQNDLMDEFEEDQAEIINNDEIDDAEFLGLPIIDKSSKYLKSMEVAKEILDQDRKLIFWCINRDTMSKACEDIKSMGFTAKEISGSVDLSDREKIIDEFKNTDLNVIVANPQTMAESVSLHSVCHDAIYLEYSFNLTHMLQSRDRIHRLGLNPTDQTNYYYFISEGREGLPGYIDEKIYSRLKDKENLMKKAVDGTKLSIDIDVDEKEEISRIIGD